MATSKKKPVEQAAPVVPVLTKLPDHINLDAIRDEWVAIGKCTLPADRPRAEAGVVMAYKAAGYKPPRRFVWVDSPKALRKATKQSSLSGACIYGQHDAAWLAFYDTFGRAGLQDVVAPLAGLMEVAKSANWWFPCTTVCYIVERPDFFNIDTQGRLHHDTRSAVSYRDGFAVWVWHGVKVTKQIIESPETLTAEQVRAETNIEVRRVMTSRMGGRWVEQAGLKRVQADDYGELYKDDDNRQAWVLYTDAVLDHDGTPKKGWLRVPYPTETARAGVSWSYSLRRPEDYNPYVRT